MIWGSTTHYIGDNYIYIYYNIYIHTHIIIYIYIYTHIISLWESLSSNRGVCLFEQGNSSEALRRFEHFRSFSHGLQGANSSRPSWCQVFLRVKGDVQQVSFEQDHQLRSNLIFNGQPSRALGPREVYMSSSADLMCQRLFKMWFAEALLANIADCLEHQGFTGWCQEHLMAHHGSVWCAGVSRVEVLWQAW